MSKDGFVMWTLIPPEHSAFVEQIASAAVVGGNLASSAAAMLNSLQRLNAGAGVGARREEKEGSGGRDTAASIAGSAAGIEPEAMRLPEGTPFRPGDFFAFDEEKFRYVHSRPLLPPPLSAAQAAAEATIAAVKTGAAHRDVGRRKAP